jgi:hypothetical protein
MVYKLDLLALWSRKIVAHALFGVAGSTSIWWRVQIVAELAYRSSGAMRTSRPLFTRIGIGVRLSIEFAVPTHWRKADVLDEKRNHSSSAHVDHA